VLKLNNKCDAELLYSIPDYRIGVGALEKNSDKSDLLQNLGKSIQKALQSNTNPLQYINQSSINEDEKYYRLVLPVGLCLILPAEIFIENPYIGYFNENNQFIINDEDLELSYLIERLTFNDIRPMLTGKDSNVNIYIENQKPGEEECIIDYNPLIDFKSDYSFFKITNLNDHNLNGAVLSMKYNKNFKSLNQYVTNFPCYPSNSQIEKYEKTHFFSFILKTKTILYTLKNVLPSNLKTVSYSDFETNLQFLQNFCSFTANYLEHEKFFNSWCFNNSSTSIEVKPGDLQTLQFSFGTHTNLFENVQFYIQINPLFAWLFSSRAPLFFQNGNVQIPLKKRGYSVILREPSNKIVKVSRIYEIYFYNFKTKLISSSLTMPYFIRINDVARENVFLVNNQAIKCLAILTEQNGFLSIADKFDHKFSSLNRPCLNFDIIDRNNKRVALSNDSFIMLKITQV